MDQSLIQPKELVEEKEPSIQSPTKPRYADRFMPSRSGNCWNYNYPETPKKKTHQDHSNIVAIPFNHEAFGAEPVVTVDDDDDKTSTYSCLLKNEVLGYDFDSATVLASPKKPTDRKLFHFDCTERPVKGMSGEMFSSYASSPISNQSCELMRTPVRKRRRIAKAPYRVLDAPELADDYYLNLLDWSSRDVICVGLGNHVYSWSGTTGGVSLIVDMSGKEDHPTSVKWNNRGSLVGIGTGFGTICIYDIEAEKFVLEKQAHNMRIGALEWNGESIISGSRDKSIKMMDIRSPSSSEIVFQHHKQEICGLRWSMFNSMLASGGNDNAVLLWSLQSRKPVTVLNGHVAAVKALSWSPHDRHVLASGGGTSDRCLKFWNTITGSCVASINTESQVCNVAWSQQSKELVTTHGFAQNNVAVWKYPSMNQVASLKGHSQRVLYMALSPDGNSVCTGAADETIRFWQVFERNGCRARKSSLDLFEGIR